MSIRLSGSGSPFAKPPGAKEWSLVAFFWLAIGLATGCGSARDTVSGQIHLDDGTIQGRQFEGDSMLTWGFLTPRLRPMIVAGNRLLL